jgi:hypothetical protein
VAIFNKSSQLLNFASSNAKQLPMPPSRDSLRGLKLRQSSKSIENDASGLTLRVLLSYRTPKENGAYCKWCRLRRNPLRAMPSRSKPPAPNTTNCCCHVMA